MNRQEFEEYCEKFSSGIDKASIFDRYYDPDAVFEHPLKGTFEGKKALVEFWTAGHEGIHEVLKPLNVLFDGNQIAAEFLIEWHCLEDTEYLGHRKKGDVYYAECAAFYHLKNDKFVRVKLYLKEKK
ncbi:MAG: nuclear transport factor 2 family protein [Phycisphaerae bacterium]|nr:nuclear transport factor 2 family protein [Phycisphaerae bacterium]